MYTDKDAIIGMRVFGLACFAFGFALVLAYYAQSTLYFDRLFVDVLIKSEAARAVGALCLSAGLFLLNLSNKQIRSIDSYR